MKKIIICILSISVLVVGVFSVAALAKNADGFSENKQGKVTVQPDDVKLNKTADIEMLNTQKEIIFNNILNCIDYYDAVSGTFETTLIDGNPVTVSYDVNIPKQISLESAKGTNIDMSILCRDEKILEANNLSKKYTEERFISQYDGSVRKKHTTSIDKQVSLQSYYNYEQKDVSSKRAKKNADGQMEFYYRQDLTNTGLASISIFPQNLVFGFMTEFDAWKVSGIETYLNRQVLVIAGKTADKDYAEKLNVDAFIMKFDLNTGVLLDFKGYLSTGELTQNLTTAEFAVEKSKSDLNDEITQRITSIQNAYEKTNRE